MPWLELVVYFITPIVAAVLAKRKGLGWLDPVLTCYGVGLLLANLPIDVNTKVTESLTEAVVPLAIPLLLFKTDFVRWVRSSRATVIGFVVAVCSAVFSLIVVSFFYRDSTERLDLAAGMLAGAWTGGSPNLVSVASALDAPREAMVLTNAADIFVGGIYLLALLTFARPLLGKLLPEPDEVEPMTESVADVVALKKRVLHGFAVLGIGLVIVAASAGLSMLIFQELSTPFVILGITTGGIAISFVPAARELEMSYELGNYLILVFCVAIGALTDLAELMASGGTFLSFTAVALVLTLFLHYVVCRFTKVDVDTAIITSVATIMGPALVVPVARRLNNRAAFVSGITSGLVGYAMANYVGIAIANLAAAM